MADLIEIHPGSVPWEPAGELRRVYHRYDMPLLGIVRQHGIDYLFRCVVGELESFNLWSYTILMPDEVDALDEAAAEQQSMNDIAEDIALSRSGVLAVAIDAGDSIPLVILSTRHEDSGPRALIDALEDIKGKLNEYVERMQGGRDSFERTLQAI